MKKYFRVVAKVIISVYVIALPVLVEAHPLSITNHTSILISFKVNGFCAKAFGTVYPNQTITIAEAVLNTACANYNFCEIMGYDAKNCEGNPVGGMRYLTEHDIEVFSAGQRNISVAATEDSLVFAEEKNRS